MSKRQTVGDALDAFLPESKAETPTKAAAALQDASGAEGETLRPLTIHISDGRRRALVDLAAREDRSLGWIVRAASAEYLARSSAPIAADPP